MKWFRVMFGLDRKGRVNRDLDEAKAEHRRRVARADYVLAEAFRKADSILRPYPGPERRRNPR